jgi:hypothetical protein
LQRAAYRLVGGTCLSLVYRLVGRTCLSK